MYMVYPKIVKSNDFMQRVLGLKVWVKGKNRKELLLCFGAIHFTL